MAKFKRQFNLDKSGKSIYKGAMHNGTGEINQKESLTRPNMNLTIKQLLKNHTRGLPTEAHNFEKIYTGEVSVPQFADITEFHEWKQTILNRATDFAKENLGNHLDAAEKRLKTRLKIGEEGHPAPPAVPEGQE